MIPGTQFWIATGIYIDDIKARRAQIYTKLNTILRDALTMVGIGVGAGFLFLVLPLSVCIVRSILVPLRKVTAKAQEVAEGNLEVKVLVSGKDEIARLEKALGLMLEKLNNNIREIENPQPFGGRAGRGCPAVCPGGG